MRHLLLTTAALAALTAFAGTPAFAEEGGHDKPKTEEGAKGKTANRVDPTTGKPVDHKVETLTIKFDKHEIVVGFSSKESYEAASKADDKTKELIAEAAKTHKVIKDGKLVEMEKHEKHGDDEKQHKEEKK